MLLRPGGGLRGIKAYLEKGHKQGRSHSRDQLDERVVLADDLEVTDAIIQRINSTTENYKHFTLSFKEDSMDRETLLAITREFEAFAFAAYRKGEYNLYAEAHIPRIKSYTDAQSGVLVERKPHIHIVIPKLNLLSGHVLNPLGMTNHHVEFMDAWQEHINAKYGLASPKDNRRIPFTDESTMISRHKGDVFGGQGSNLKHAILNAMLERRVERYEDFIAMLPEFGETRIRNAGKEGAYPNVKAIGVSKGVNLKDYVFSREFVELPIAEKHQRLNAEPEFRCETVQPSRSSPKHLESILTEWREVRAKEIKYLNSGNKVLYAHYRAADEPTRRSLLAARESQFYAKFQQKEPHENRKPSPKRPHQRQPHIEPIATLATAAPPTSVVGQLARDLNEHQKVRSVHNLDEFKAIRAQLSARALLETLATSHGVMLEKYTITQAKDGSDRIQCGARHLNISDFLTKEMNLPWAESAKILRDCMEAERKRLLLQEKEQETLARLTHSIAAAEGMGNNRIQIRDHLRRDAVAASHG